MLGAAEWTLARCLVVRPLGVDCHTDPHLSDGDGDGDGHGDGHGHGDGDGHGHGSHRWRRG